MHARTHVHEFVPNKGVRMHRARPLQLACMHMLSTDGHIHILMSSCQMRELVCIERDPCSSMYAHAFS
jgi:hypothetical protein